MTQIDSKLDKLLDSHVEHKVHLARIDERLESYNDMLKEHMRRTEISEQRLDEIYRYKWLAVGAIAVITFAIQIAGKALIK